MDTKLGQLQLGPPGRTSAKVPARPPTILQNGDRRRRWLIMPTGSLKRNTTLRIPPGTVVSEALLSERFGVGRTPVREALQRLAREGLVAIMPRRGVVVSEINVAAQLRLLEVRRELERLMVRSAVRRASQPQRKRFREIASAMDQAARRADDLAFMPLDREFNLLLLDAAGNEFGAATLGMLNGLSRRFWYARLQTGGRPPADSALARHCGPINWGRGRREGRCCLGRAHRLHTGVRTSDDWVIARARTN
jgi:DNA-binding GntR family transcriptional regulator